MTPAKKAAPKKKIQANVPPPPPVLTPPQRRFWMSIQKKNVIGGVMFLLGIGFCIGFWVSDRAHGVEKVVLGVGVFLVVAGAHFMSSGPTEQALKAIGGAVKNALPGKSNGGGGG